MNLNLQSIIQKMTIFYWKKKNTYPCIKYFMKNDITRDWSWIFRINIPEILD